MESTHVLELLFEICSIFFFFLLFVTFFSFLLI